MIPPITIPNRYAHSQIYTFKKHTSFAVLEEVDSFVYVSYFLKESMVFGRNVDFMLTSMCWSRIHPGWSGRVPGASQTL